MGGPDVIVRKEVDMHLIFEENSEENACDHGAGIVRHAGGRMWIHLSLRVRSKTITADGLRW